MGIKSGISFRRAFLFTISKVDVYGSQWVGDSKRILVAVAKMKWRMLFKIIPLGGGNPVEVKTDVNVDMRKLSIGFSKDLTKLAFSVKREDRKKDLYIVPFSLRKQPLLARQN